MGHPRPRLEFRRTDEDEVSIRKDGSLIGHIYQATRTSSTAAGISTSSG